MENQLTRILDIFMVIFHVHNKFNDFHCVGSSYVASPDGSRTPVRKNFWISYHCLCFFSFVQGLSRIHDGLLVVECDLNLCRQMKDKWGFRMTQRLDLYADSLTRAVRPDYKMDIIKDPSLTK